MISITLLHPFCIQNMKKRHEYRKNASFRKHKKEMRETDQSSDFATHYCKLNSVFARDLKAEDIIENLQ